jgi:hypothetical protein
MVFGTSGSTLRGVALGIAAGCLLLLAHTAPAQEQPRPGLGELWEEYPLGPATSTDVQPTQEPSPPAAPTSPPVPSSGTNWTPLALGAAGGVGLLALLAAGALVATARRRALRPATTSSYGDARDELIARAHALAKEAEECDILPEGQRDEGVWGMTETVDHDLSSASETPREANPYADIGERVAEVLAAAETAANEFLDDARRTGEQLLEAARQEAEDVRRKAAAYEADTREAVDSFAANRRREAEREVQQQLVDSETQARATRQAAEAMARQIEEEGKRRGEELREEAKSLEERLKKALLGLRRMTVEIEQLLAPASEDAESLADALKPYGRRAGETQEPLVASPDETS